ncbi:MAG: hypothetical protein LBV46_02640 [Bacteroidales bacterium]|jgi:hypothetical protein|nr:hypothetical protein [Bacteroidales bacterium]
MSLFNFNKHETRKYSYKPQFYDPDKEETSGEKNGELADHSQEFAKRLHSAWDSKRQRKEKKSFPAMTLMLFVFFAVVVGYLYYKFYMK